MDLTELMKRPLPKLDEPDTGPFWEAARRHELVYQECDDCGEIVFFPRSHCTACLSRSLSWKASVGAGAIYTFSVVRINRHPAYSGMVPYVVAWVDLDEGFRMMTHIVDVAPEDITVGARVEVRWQDLDEVTLPVFAPV